MLLIGGREGAVILLGLTGLLISKYGGLNNPFGVFCGGAGIPGVDAGVGTIPEIVGTRDPGTAMDSDFLRC